MTTGVGLVRKGCSSADKGQVSGPSAALIGSSNSDPSPVEASTRTVHCLKQGAWLQSDITITAAAAGSHFSSGSASATS